MPVQILSEGQKDFIIQNYKNKVRTQKQLAEHYAVSQRTINRVLIEAGAATPVARIKGEAYQVMQLLKKYNLDKDSLEVLLSRHFPAGAIRSAA